MSEVLLYSGGLDSFVLNYTINPDKRLMFDLGTEESMKEVEMALNSPFEVEVVEGIDLEQFSLDNDIIPHRNTIMALLASNYGNQVYLGATKGDTTKDKDFVWAEMTEGMLNYFGKDSHKVAHDDYPYGVIMPFKDMTKTDIVEKYLDMGGHPKELVRWSRSCYNADTSHKECGECRSCIRKAIALELNDIMNYGGQYFESNPFNNISEEDHEKLLSRKGEAEDYRKFLKENPEYLR